MMEQKNTKMQYVVLYCILALMTIVFILFADWLTSIYPVQ